MSCYVFYVFLFVMSYLFFCTALWSTLVVLKCLISDVGLDWIGTGVSSGYSNKDSVEMGDFFFFFFK